MELAFDGETLSGDGTAREQCYDSSGYGRPLEGGVELAPVEAAHLLFRGDVAAVVDERSGERLDFEAFLASSAVSEVAFFVYAELRNRGFYLSPARRGWVDDPTGDFVVYPRGQGPWDDGVAYRVRAVSEREPLDAGELVDLARESENGDPVLAVVDEESETTYLELDRPPITGSTFHDLEPATGTVLSERVLVGDPPSGLHERAFYGQRLGQDNGPVQLSLVEATDLATRGLLEVGGGDQSLRVRGRSVEGERFDRRLLVYSALRTAGVVPKTGFKFGADFRTYADVASVEELGHSELLVRVRPADERIAPRDLALDVRLAHGVRKRMVYALVEDEDIEWLAVERLTP